MTQKQVNEVGRLVNWLEGMPQLRKVVVALDAKFTVAVTRQHKLDRRVHSATYIVTLGTPNYAMRALIAKTTHFPVSKTYRETR